MDDKEINHRIQQLVDEEHELFHRGSEGGLDETERQRLDSLQVALDQCWDLLRQRRALREFGRDPDEARVRDPETVENYLQ
jgi:hypothetical protein